MSNNITRPDSSVANLSVGKSIKAYLKQFQLLVRLKRKVWRLFYRSKEITNIDVLYTFPLYVPKSAGSYTAKAALTIQAINQAIPFLSSIATSVGHKNIHLIDIERFPQSSEDIAAANELKTYLDRYGSDKSNRHNYHHLYGPLLKNRNDIKNVFEVGLGTHNIDVVSTMGQGGKPGASLRAFRDFLHNANIFGADIDRRVLFKEDRIETFYVDQTDEETFEPLRERLPAEIDLIIDDGLHSPNANIQTLKFGLSKVRIGGWVVVEDIIGDAIPVWEVVAALLPTRYESHLFKAEGAIVFAVQRLH